MPQKDYRRLGGWLLFFTITLGLGLGMNLTTLLQVFAAGYQVDWIGVALTAAAVAAQGAMFYQIVARRPEYRQVIVLLAVLLSVTDLYTLIRVGPYVQLILTVALGIVRNVIWVLYFQRSQRVAVYFGQQTQPFGMNGPRRCPYCGNPVGDDAIFCGKCGRPLR